MKYLQNNYSPDEGLHGKPDDSGKQEEGRDQDVEQRQRCKGFRGFGTGFINDVVRHERLQENDITGYLCFTDFNKS